MEGERVDWPYMVDVVDSLPVTLEGVFFVLDFAAGIKIFYSNPSFNGGSGVTFAPLLARNRLNVESNFTLTVRHASQGSCHELQATLAYLCWGIHLADVVNVEQPTGHCNHKIMVDKIHLVDTFGCFMRCLLRNWSTRIPEADASIPGASDECVCTPRSA